MRMQIILSIFVVLTLIQCDQVPHSLDKDPFFPGSEIPAFAVSINVFEFDYLSQEFFFSVTITSPEELDLATARLGTSPDNTITLSLNDAGLEGDILIGDDRYDGSWKLPESDSSYVDSLWSLDILVRDIASNELQASQTLQPVRPAAPQLGRPIHLDTLVLVANDLTLDTLTLEVTHPNGLDEIRDVTLISRKPDGTLANSGQPIPLYDDGGSEVFLSFNGVDFTSGDGLANDGVYSLLLILTPDNLTGVYHWTFYSRSWQGVQADPVIDSVTVLPAGSLAGQDMQMSSVGGVFQ